ncbi:MAG TPA: hypothetical protein VHV10_12700, partial [Ktedonobacteraceae bacterium]|nr:hypothetical protein [Ktedonobacteraceae bacterium]
VLFIIVVTLADLVKTLYPNIDVLAAMPFASSNDLSSKTSDHGSSPEVSRNMDSSRNKALLKVLW